MRKGGDKQLPRKIDNSKAFEIQFLAFWRNLASNKFTKSIESIVFCKFSCSVLSFYEPTTTISSPPCNFFPDLNVLKSGLSNDWGRPFSFSCPPLDYSLHVRSTF